jgi:hypothetical protein
MDWIVLLLCFCIALLIQLRLRRVMCPGQSIYKVIAFAVMFAFFGWFSSQPVMFLWFDVLEVSADGRRIAAVFVPVAWSALISGLLGKKYLGADRFF